MIDFFSSLFYFFRLFFKDEPSAIGMVAYFIFLDMMAFAGFGRRLFMHEGLRKLPPGYEALLLLLATLCTVCLWKEIGIRRKLFEEQTGTGEILKGMSGAKVFAFGAISFILMLIAL